jgi:hypothetical protein
MIFEELQDYNGPKEIVINEFVKVGIYTNSNNTIYSIYNKKTGSIVQLYDTTFNTIYTLLNKKKKIKNKRRKEK